MTRIILIPARLESSRLPKKVLLDLGGKPMIQRVYDQCIQVKDADVFIATDSEEIKTNCTSFTKNILLTRKDHPSGTDRVAEALEQLDHYESVINGSIMTKFMAMESNKWERPKKGSGGR